jgi:modulator of drug activity B
MQILNINTHLTYPGWSEGKLDLAKAFFVERGHPVAETFVERGYVPEEEVKKHAAADLVILQTPVNWFSAPWIYKKYVDEVFNVGLAKDVFLAGDGRTRQDPGRQYGTGGKMQGKKFMICATWNAPREAFDNPLAYYTPARELPTSFSTSLPTTSSQATTFSRIMGFSISLKTPTSRARLKTTSGIWRNTACDLVSWRT